MKLIDISGRTFHSLEVIGKNGNRDRQGRLLWTCRCKCGKIIAAIGQHLASGHTRSCGCRKLEVALSKREGWVKSVYQHSVSPCQH